ncbi:MAG: hypothetical protein ACKO2Z_28400, partial [Sphaerospermopsis kisseleviana]
DPKAANYDPREELNYDPLRRFEKDILSVFKGDDENAKKELLGKLKKGFDKFKVQKKVDILKEVLTNLIKRETPFPERQYPVHISVKNSILENDIETITERDTLFKNTLRGNFKDCLKYIHLGNPSTQTNILVTLPANITISEIHFLETPDVETFDMEYDITSGIKVLPAIFLGIDNQQCRNFYESNLKNRNLLVFPHRLEEQKLEKHQEFIYKIVYSLLAYLCLHVIL